MKSGKKYDKFWGMTLMHELLLIIACIIMWSVIINCIIMIGELVLCININMLYEYVCCCHACLNYAMVSHNVSMKMWCRVGDLIWYNCAFVMHHWCTNFGSVVCSGPLVGSGASIWFLYDGNNEVLLIQRWVISNDFGVLWFSGVIGSE